MIKRESLLREIHSAMDMPFEGETRGESALRAIALHVLQPMMDALEFDARPLYRELILGEVRDLLTPPPLIPKAKSEEPGRLEISDE